MNKIIFFELNEVPLRIFNYYRKMRPYSWLALNYDNLRKFETISENTGNLSPWNTWPTLHRGVSNEDHGIKDFNQDLSKVDQEFPPLWKILVENDRKVGVFGSLHSYPLPDSKENFEFYVPDVFAASSECLPKDVELFQELNLKLSRKSARNVDKSIPYKNMVKLLLKSGTLGFRPSTISAVGNQFLNERITSWKGVRRRTYQAVLSFDIFYKLLDKNKPDFVSFYTNHVASSLHRYWAATFPDDYEVNLYEQDWRDRYGNEIIFTLDKADQMLSKLARFVEKHPEYKLVITSSMGQDAVPHNPIESQTYIHDHEKFMKALGIDKDHFNELPAMRPQFNYEINPENFQDFVDVLDNVVINGKKLSYRISENNRFSFDFGHRNFKEIVMTLHGNQIAAEDTGLKNVKIEDRSASTALHVPEGHLFVFHPSFQTSELTDGQVETQYILPSLLNNFSIKTPDYMKKGSGTIFN